jgi:choline-sulfatase
MRILYLDCDTLRADHLGCYGYHRRTSPNIDWIASEGVRFTECWASDVPCLPSRAALWNGRLGIHNGVVNHGGVAADLPLEGPDRGFHTRLSETTWMAALRRAGFHTASISPFAERHSAWWFNAGFTETHNPGKRGNETADEVLPVALDWIRRNAQRDHWFLHVNFWDPHTPYRTPMAYGNPFEHDPPPAWLTEERRREHFAGYGSHSAQDTWHFEGGTDEQLKRFPRIPRHIASLDDFKRWIDGYDTGIRYMDDHIGRLLDALREQGVLDGTAILFSTDHGENQGELNIYGDHQTADDPTCHIPLIIRWPGMARGVDGGLHYNIDLAATVCDLAGAKRPEEWDAVSFAQTVRAGQPAGREFLVVSQCAWACQRSVRFGPWLLMRTYHDGLKDLKPLMLFDLAEDPHELNDLAAARPEIVKEGLVLLERWGAEMMATSAQAADPLWTVMREGGPYHTRGFLDSYCARLRATGRARHAEALEAHHHRG